LSDWTSLGHEWFHALDDTLGKSGAVWRWRSAQISGWSQTGLKPPEAGREDWLASSWWSAAAGWGRRVALITEGNYSPANDRRNQVAQQAVQTLWVGLAEPSLSATQRARILEVLRIRREELVGLRTEKRTNTIHKEPSGAISGENLIFNRSRAALASTPVERLGSAQGMSSPWFNLRARTKGKIEQAISQVSLSLMPHGYRFDKDAVVDYVTDPTEMLAYAFSAQVALQGAKVGAKPILVDPEIAHDRKPEWNMTQSEAQVHTGAWTAFFKTLGPWWEQDRTQRMGPTATTVAESKNIDAVVSKPRAATTAAARQMADAQVTPKRRRGP
jgi:hypothetical protein